MLTAKENYQFHAPYKATEVYDADADAVYHIGLYVKFSILYNGFP